MAFDPLVLTFNIWRGCKPTVVLNGFKGASLWKRSIVLLPPQLERVIGSSLAPRVPFDRLKRLGSTVVLLVMADQESYKKWIFGEGQPSRCTLWRRKRQKNEDGVSQPEFIHQDAACGTFDADPSTGKMCWWFSRAELPNYYNCTSWLTRPGVDLMSWT